MEDVHVPTNAELPVEGDVDGDPQLVGADGACNCALYQHLDFNLLTRFICTGSHTRLQL